MLEQRTAPIGGHEYTVTMLPARRGRSVGARLGKIFAPAAKEQASISDVLANLGEADLAFICEEFAAQTTVREDGQPAELPLVKIFDLHFAGRYGDMFKWLQFCVEVNFGSFLGELGLKLPEATTPAPKAA